MIYLDHNASTQVDPTVVAAMLPWFSENYANPSNGKYHQGRVAQRAIDNVGEQVVEFFGFNDHITQFTSSATESNLSVLFSFQQSMFDTGQLVCGPLEHNSLSSQFCRESKKVSYFIPNADGVIDINSVRNVEISSQDFVFLQWVNSETGAVNSIGEISEYLEKIGCYYHVDATQALGKIIIENDSLKYCTSLTISAHKMYGPKGVSALILKRGFPFRPLLTGGSGRTYNRAGTENVPGIVGLGAALKLISDNQASICLHQTRLLIQLESGLRSLGYENTILSPLMDQRASNTLMMAWPNFLSKDILVQLDREDICVSAGSACSSEKSTMSDTLINLKVDEKIGMGAIRFSIGKDNTFDEMNLIIDIMDKVLLRISSQKA